METETKHTPGPWVYRKQMTGITGVRRDLYGIGYERDNAVWFVAEHANEEDARLIAAAPDLLAAAKALIRESPSAASPAWLALRDAMAKAEGFE